MIQMDSLSVVEKRTPEKKTYAVGVSEAAVLATYTAWTGATASSGGSKQANNDEDGSGGSGALVSSLQIPAVSGAGMAAATFGTEQLNAMGAISLGEFEGCLSLSLVPTLAAMERSQVPLSLRGQITAWAWPNDIQVFVNAAVTKKHLQSTLRSIISDARER